MTDKKEPMKIEFAPGCFDNFEGTQEELDELVKEIQTMFTTMTPEELAERSVPIDVDDLDDETVESLVRQLGIDVDAEDVTPRKLH